jgi:hypothetical protein
LGELRHLVDMLLLRLLGAEQEMLVLGRGEE